jgi:hypothetical protein
MMSVVSRPLSVVYSGELRALGTGFVPGQLTADKEPWTKNEVF